MIRIRERITRVSFIERIMDGEPMKKKSDEVLVEEARKVSYAMIEYGGGFASALGKALSCADLENTRKIYKTWPEIWRKYLSMYELAGERQE